MQNTTPNRRRQLAAATLELYRPPSRIEMIRGRSVVELSEEDLAYLVGYEAAIAHASQMDDLRAGIEDARRDAA